MKSRRHFIRDISILGATSKYLISARDKAVTASSTWSDIAEQYFVDPNGNSNFNTGSAGVMPIPIYQAYIKNVQSLCEYAPYEIKARGEENIQIGLQQLAQLINAQPDELALVRNSTEGLNHILLGFPFKKGDEIVMSDMAYPYVKTMVKRLKELKNIKVKLVSLNSDHFESEDIVSRFEQNMTPQTAMVITTAITHQFGYKMPVKALGQLAHRYDSKILVDGAHCVGHIALDIEGMGCDFFVSSLHKWMSAPLGSGILFIKKGLASKISPFLPCPNPHEESMHKFEYTGTVAYQNALTLGAVIDFHEAIGSEKKYARIASLSSMLLDQLSEISEIKILTDRQNPCGIVSFTSEDVIAYKLNKQLEHRYNIHAKVTGYRNLSFVRASVNLHLLEMDIMHFAQSVKKIVVS